MQTQETKTFLEKYNTNQHTDAEHQAFIQWLEAAPLEEKETIAEAYLHLLDKKSTQRSTDIVLSQKIEAALDAYEVERNNNKTLPIIHRIHFLKTAWFKYAAAVILTAGIGITYYLANKSSSPTISKNQQTAAQAKDIPPGTNKAVLTLANGNIILLDNSNNGTIAQQGNAQVVKLNNGQIAYNIKGPAEGEVMMNTMTTPKGGQYQLTLPDGTKAWLNAASSITYPAMFASKERKVKVTGEVYFDIAKDSKRPFYVTASDAEIQVIGTSFNVNDYADEEGAKTSLIEGAIKVGNAILKPGQAYINGKVIATNIEQDLAWKNGIFDFNHVPLKKAMNQLARWYDLEIVYEGDLPPFDFYGKIWKNLPLSDVLKGLTGLGVNFRLEEKKLIVSAK